MRAVGYLSPSEPGRRAGRAEMDCTDGLTVRRPFAIRAEQQRAQAVDAATLKMCITHSGLLSNVRISSVQLEFWRKLVAIRIATVKLARGLEASAHRGCDQSAIVTLALRRAAILSGLLFAGLAAGAPCTAWAHTHIWTVDDEPITAFAFDRERLTLIVGRRSNPHHLDLIESMRLDGSRQRLATLKRAVTQIAIGKEREIFAFFPENRFQYFPGNPAELARIEGDSCVTILPSKNRVIDPGGDFININPASILVARDGALFVTEERRVVTGDRRASSRLVSPAASPSQYVVWRLDKDATNQWHAKSLIFGDAQPTLYSSRSGKASLLADPTNPYRFMPEVYSDRDFGARRTPRAPSGFQDIEVAGVAEEDDGALLIADSANARIWRTAAPTNAAAGAAGSVLTEVAGSADALHSARKFGTTTHQISAGSIAAAPEGGFFLNDNGVLRFVGPRDEFESRLAHLTSAAEGHARAGKFEEAATNVRELERLRDWAGLDGTRMRQWRARIALTTLKTRLSDEGFEHVQAAVAAQKARMAKSWYQRLLCL